MLNDGFAAPSRPRASTHEDQRAVDLVVSLVAVACGIPASRISDPRARSQPARRARRVAMYLTSTHYSWPQWRVAAAFGSDRSTSTNACRAIEDAREDPAFDRRLVDLEDCLRASPSTALPGWGADDDHP